MAAGSAHATLASRRSSTLVKGLPSGQPNTRFHAINFSQQPSNHSGRGLPLFHISSVNVRLSFLSCLKWTSGRDSSAFWCYRCLKYCRFILREMDDPVGSGGSYNTSDRSESDGVSRSNRASIVTDLADNETCKCAIEDIGMPFVDTCNLQVYDRLDWNQECVPTAPRIQGPTLRCRILQCLFPMLWLLVLVLRPLVVKHSTR